MEVIEPTLLKVGWLLWAVAVFAIGYIAYKTKGNVKALLAIAAILAISSSDMFILGLTIVVIGLGSVFALLVSYLLRWADYWEELEEDWRKSDNNE